MYKTTFAAAALLGFANAITIKEDPPKEKHGEHADEVGLAQTADIECGCDGDDCCEENVCVENPDSDQVVCLEIAVDWGNPDDATNLAQTEEVGCGCDGDDCCEENVCVENPDSDQVVCLEIAVDWGNPDDATNLAQTGQCCMDDCENCQDVDVANPNGEEVVTISVGYFTGDEVCEGEQRFRDWIDSQSTYYTLSPTCSYEQWETYDCCTDGAEYSYRTILIAGEGCPTLRLGANMTASEWDDLLWEDNRQADRQCGAESGGKKDCYYDLAAGQRAGFQVKSGDYGMRGWVMEQL